MKIHAPIRRSTTVTSADWDVGRSCRVLLSLIPVDRVVDAGTYRSLDKPCIVNTSITYSSRNCGYLSTREVLRAWTRLSSVWTGGGEGGGFMLHVESVSGDLNHAIADRVNCRFDKTGMSRWKTWINYKHRFNNISMCLVSSMHVWLKQLWICNIHAISCHDAVISSWVSDFH